jgi:hypothetical protein
MGTHLNRLWLIVLFLGVALDVLFWKHIPGISFLIYVLLCLAGGFFVLGRAGLRPGRNALLLLLPILCFAFFSFIRQEPFSIFLSYAFTLFWLALLSVSYLGGRWPDYGLADYVVKYLELLASVLARSLAYYLSVRRTGQNTLPASGDEPGEAGVLVQPADPAGGEAAARSADKKARRTVWPVVRGILIAAPVLIFFAALLSAADMVFAQRLKQYADIFRIERLPEYIFRLAYILIAAYSLGGVLLHAAVRSQDEKLIGEEKPLVAPFLGFVEAVIVLGAVVALFAFFVLIQFQYFFSGQANINLEGFTYAEYARRGFGELIAVAFFSWLLFLGLSLVTRREDDARRKVFSGLGIALLALVGVILLSAYQRLLLYEAAYGFSRLRTYTHVFIIWLGVLLAAAVALEIVRRQRAFALAALLAALGFALTLNLLNVDAFIARQNIARSARGDELDVAYLATLSLDAAPALVAQYRSPGLPEDVRDAVGAALACMSDQQASRHDVDTSWQAFRLGAWLGQRALDSVTGDLAGYSVETTWPRTVRTPLQVEYPCWTTAYDD